MTEYLPNEILSYIFSYLKPKHLSKCREVCSRWKSLVDNIFRSEFLWRKHCQSDFKYIYKAAYNKRTSELSWCSLYRSLSLWSKLQHATEILDEFASASCDMNEIHDFQVLRHGELGIHTRGGIVYYNLTTQRQTNRCPIPGDYLNYVENDHVIIIMSFTADLHVIRKVLRSPYHEKQSWFPSVLSFHLHEDELYYSTRNNDVYICYLLCEKIQSTLLIHMEEGIMCLGHKNGYLNVLTQLRNIFTIVDEVHVFRRTLDNKPNLFHELAEYNLLQNLDWRIYFLWMYVLNHTIPPYALRDIIVTRVYGDVVFVGSNMGIFRIYYAPYLNNQLDIFNTEPVKEYNFRERQDCPVLTDSPIIQIDVLEGEDCHTVLVGMPKKIAVLKFCHDFKRHPAAIEFEEEVQSIEIE